ncbi:MAG: hypothetical protein ACW96S_14980 [Promethearchaeota archaeon]|jgi:hypothetical protein
MTIDFSKKRYSIILAGILLAFVASIIIVIALGIGDFKTHSNQEFETFNRGPSLDMSVDMAPSIIYYEECFKERQLVPGAEVAFELNHDVEPGWMEVQYDIPYEFPICITEDYVDQNFGITVWSYGGYHPDDLGGNYMVLYQPKTGKGGILDITWEESLEELPCSTTIFTASFDIVGGGPIILESNHLPQVITNADYPFLLEAEPTCNLDKWVHVGVFSSWAGCDDVNQKFKLILVHYHCVLRIPNSRI